MGMKAADLQRRSRMPMYLQLAKLLRQRIESREWLVGQQIPTLDALEQEYGVSRITLRGALNYLEEFGVVRRTRGQGTFVTKDLSEERWYKLANTLDELANKVADLDVRLLLIEQSERPPVPAFPYGQLAKAYRCFKRVHYHKDVPYCVIDIYLEKTIFDSDPQGFIQSPVIQVLANRTDIHIAGARQIMRVVVAEAEVAAHLHIGIGDPVADVCRTLVDQDDHIIYYAHIRYPTQMIQIETDLMPRAAPVAPAATTAQVDRKASADRAPSPPRRPRNAPKEASRGKKI